MFPHVLYCIRDRAFTDGATSLQIHRLCNSKPPHGQVLLLPRLALLLLLARLERIHPLPRVFREQVGYVLRQGP